MLVLHGLAGAAAALMAAAVSAVNPDCFPSCLADTPPMGWRSWNVFGGGPNQQGAYAIVDALVAAKLPAVLDPSGPNVSLAQLGYNRFGKDDYWQACGAGVNGSFHNEFGFPIFNTDWPNVANFTSYAHARNIYVDWYANNDGCDEYGLVGPYYDNDVYMHVLVNGVDGIKFDSNGPARNMTQWAAAINATGRAILIENCNNNDPFRPSYNADGTLDCPYHFFRTSIDNSPNWMSAISNMMDTAPFLSISQPGCWAYADALEVGAPAASRPDQCDPPRMSVSEARGAFAGFAVISSPLILSFDVANDTEYATWWPIISNTRAIGINQAWAGSAGALVAASPSSWSGAVHHGAVCEVASNRSLPLWTAWAKPLPGGQVAALVMNTLNVSTPFSVPFTALGFAPSVAQLSTEDVWTGAQQPPLTGGAWNDTLSPNGHFFYVLTAA